jgi:hypothetical protein
VDKMRGLSQGGLAYGCAAILFLVGVSDGAAYFKHYFIFE